MTNLHRHLIEQLMPCALGDNQARDAMIEGGQLDSVAASADMLRLNMFADSANELLTDWERLLGLYPVAGTSAIERREACVAKLLARGGMSRRYFIELAAELGYTIEIYEELIWQWRVHVLTSPEFLVYFRAGESNAGDALLSFGTPQLEELIVDLKPAHTFVYFSYA